MFIDSTNRNGALFGEYSRRYSFAADGASVQGRRGRILPYLDREYIPDDRHVGNLFRLGEGQAQARIGEDLSSLDRFLFKPSSLSEPRKEELRRLFNNIVGKDSDYKLEFRDGSFSEFSGLPCGDGATCGAGASDAGEMNCLSFFVRD
jgi:hypothetical protein